ncbi:MAG: 50S ribosomal protein L24 [Alphaproteobacteria bacterium]|nr:50S ribosomal protein L24 [Alphaproteobacteria bacterium]
MAAKFRRGDTVVVMTGRDKGKKGEIMRVVPAESRVYVQGVNVVKRHTRATQTSPGGIIEKEAAIHMSNVAHLDPETDEPTRVGFKTIEDNRKVRYAKRSGEIIDR